MARPGIFGTSWWAKRWMAVLESFGWANRLSRGRTYARKNHVLSLDISPGLIEARVSGSRPIPYDVTIEIEPLSESEWERVLAIMAGKALFCAQLLAGELPQELEEVFADAGTALFPESGVDLATYCSCPDWANPCKHIAAVYYLLASEFDNNPFLLLLLRGKSRAEIIAGVRSHRAALNHAADGNPGEQENAGKSHIPAETLETHPVKFWQVGESLQHLNMVIDRSEKPGHLVQKLGYPPIPGLKAGFDRWLAGCYSLISDRAMDEAFSDADENTDSRQSGTTPP